MVYHQSATFWARMRVKKWDSKVFREIVELRDKNSTMLCMMMTVQLLGIIILLSSTKGPGNIVWLIKPKNLSMQHTLKCMLLIIWLNVPHGIRPKNNSSVHFH